MLVQLFWLTDVIEFSSTVFEKLLFVNGSKYVFAPMALSRMCRIVFLLIISMSFRVGQLGGKFPRHRVAFAIFCYKIYRTFSIGGEPWVIFSGSYAEFHGPKLFSIQTGKANFSLIT